MKIVLDPIAHDEAIKMIADKPALLREQFDRLLPELQARAFTVTWIEDANVLRSIRDAIAELPQGGDWAKLREQIADELMQSGTYFDEEKSTKRAELLLRTHGFQAYQATAWQVAQETIEDFPYLQYMTMEDEAVRDAHRALNGIVLPANHPFWEDHYPPWDWGCRCQVRQISRAEYARLEKLDASRDPEQRRILSGARLKKLETDGKLALGPNMMIDVRSPKNKFAELQAAGKSPIPYSWHPSTMRIPLERLKAGYADQPEAWAHFEQYAKSVKLDDGKSLYEWLGGEDASERVLPKNKFIDTKNEEKEINMTPVKISSQRYIDDDIVEAKRAAKDYEVTLGKVINIDGQKYQVVIDGHHSLAAAKLDGVEPQWRTATVTENDREGIADIDEYLAAHYVDSSYYNLDTNNDVF